MKAVKNGFRSISEAETVFTRLRLRRFEKLNIKNAAK